VGDRGGVIGDGCGCPRRHVRVADRLDLLEAVLLGELSNSENSSLSIVTSSSGEVFEAWVVKPTRSANRTETFSKRSTMSDSPVLSRSAIGPGSTLSNKRSEVCFSAISSFVRCLTSSSRSRCELDRLGHLVEVDAELTDLVAGRDGVRAEKSLSANRFIPSRTARGSSA